MSEQFPQILIIPIDNRPVCYDLQLQASRIFENNQVFMPDISLLGSLDKTANIESIKTWAKETIECNDIDSAIIALDTIAYGGLIPSRRVAAGFDEIKNNIDEFFNIINSANKKIKVYATSSIMRIPDNNINEEEKSYWDKYGKMLFRFSYLSHKLLKNYDVELEAEVIQLAKEIPFEVVDDYLNTRKRNFEINLYYIDLVKKGLIDHLVFSQDDTAEFGFNVEEKELLWQQAIKELITPQITIKTGADEMIISLLARALVEFYNEEINIHPTFFDSDSKNIISKYEDVSIEKSANAAIKLCGGKISESNNDIELLINAPNKVQNELCLEIYEDEKSTEQTDKLLNYIENTNPKYAIADVKNANGADNYLVENLLKQKYCSDNFLGYAAWNTTGNTLGTVIAISIIKYLAQKYNCYDDYFFKKSQYTRLLDDWAYQANVRKILREKNSTETISDEMKSYKEKVSDWLDFSPETTYSFPWDRTFEIKINI